MWCRDGLHWGKLSVKDSTRQFVVPVGVVCGSAMDDVPEGIYLQRREESGTGNQQQGPRAGESMLNASCVDCYLTVWTISTGELANR